jgi:hypothetical protein
MSGAFDCELRSPPVLELLDTIDPLTAASATLFAIARRSPGCKWRIIKPDAMS